MHWGFLLLIQEPWSDLSDVRLSELEPCRRYDTGRGTRLAWVLHTSSRPRQNALSEEGCAGNAKSNPCSSIIGAARAQGMFGCEERQ